MRRENSLKQEPYSEVAQQPERKSPQWSSRHQLGWLDRRGDRLPAGLDFDPRTKFLLERAAGGFRPQATTSTGEGEIAAVLKVHDLPAFEERTDIHVTSVLSTGGDHAYLTARIPLSRLASVRGDSNVLALEVPRPVWPLLENTCRDLRVVPAMLPAGSLSHGGRGTILAVVDFGCDFTHADFLTAQGKTRLRGIWDQGAETEGPMSATNPVPYGRFYTRSEINGALARAKKHGTNAFEELGYRPDRRAGWKVGTHGTHVLGIAGGNGLGSGAPGVAPNADLLFVDLAATDVPWDGEAVVGKSFGDSIQLLEAVRFAFETAGDTPCVVNLSLGTHGGPHDGTTVVERAMDELVRGAVGRSIIVAAGNSYDLGIHATGTVTANQFSDLHWEVPAIEGGGHAEVECWYSGRDEFMVELIAPDGGSVGAVGGSQSSRILDDDGRLAVFAAQTRGASNNGDNTIGIYLAEGVPSGRWTIRLHSLIVEDGRYDAWIERNDAAQSRFTEADPSRTLGSISCGHETIVVGSYLARGTCPISYFSSAGPTRDAGRSMQKPELSAPGHDVWSAQSGTRKRRVRKSGTSMAAPAVAGVVALMFAEARARGSALSNERIRQTLIGTAKPQLTPGEWEPRYGYGRVDAAAALELVAIDSKAPPPPPAAAVSVRTKKKRSGEK